MNKTPYNKAFKAMAKSHALILSLCVNKCGGKMYALILNWDLSRKPKEIFQTLREYIANESWKRYKDKKGLIQKVWYSNEETGQFGGIYLWKTKEAMEEEIRTIRIAMKNKIKQYREKNR